MSSGDNIIFQFESLFLFQVLLTRIGLKGRHTKYVPVEGWWMWIFGYSRCPRSFLLMQQSGRPDITVVRRQQKVMGEVTGAGYCAATSFQGNECWALKTPWKSTSCCCGSKSYSKCIYVVEVHDFIIIVILDLLSDFYAKKIPHCRYKQSYDLLYVRQRLHPVFESLLMQPC